MYGDSIFCSITVVFCVLDFQKVVKIASWNVQIWYILVVSPYCILLCNSIKEKVQLVDTKDGRVLSEISLQVKWIDTCLCSESFWLCLTSKNQAAVPILNKVQFINIQGQSITLGKVLTVNYESRGVSSMAWSHIARRQLSSSVSPDSNVRSLQVSRFPDCISRRLRLRIWCGHQRNHEAELLPSAAPAHCWRSTWQKTTTVSCCWTPAPASRPSYWYRKMALKVQDGLATLMDKKNCMLPKRVT